MPVGPIAVAMFRRNVDGQSFELQVRHVLPDQAQDVRVDFEANAMILFVNGDRIDAVRVP